MKNKYIVLIALLCIILYPASVVQAQISSDDAELGCGVSDFSVDLFHRTPWEGNQEYLFQILDEEGYFQSSDSLEFIVYRIPVQLFVYRREKNPMVTEELIKTYMQDLNKYNLLNKTGIVYYLNDEMEIRNSDRRARMGYFMEAPWVSLWNFERGCVNVHIAEYIKKGKGTVRGTYNYLTNAAYVKANSSSTSLAHEIAHHFDLLHPHRNWKRGKLKQESVDRNRKVKGIFKKGRNCEHNGDKLCDTPAEPNLTSFVNKQCEYTGTITDNWGDTYKPETKNIMSYPTYRECRDEFTPSQIAVMLAAAGNKRHSSGWRVKSKGQAINQQYNFDFNEPDNTLKMATVLNRGDRQWHSFHSIYKGKRKKNTTDACDWVKVYIDNSSSNTTIRLLQANAAMPNVALQAYTENESPLQGISTDAYSITIPSSYAGQTVYIKISNKSKNPFSDYYLVVE